ncbi:hypothetical protein [Nocardioides jiangxiensis]|uniref:Uncharacterized protein n=1 Tax=Nocardioides jiangxiensis TaxID=3064524 RepID=A0ABT9AZM4_9ACTN|nr:hypothetical protein [Nocardioides sp. WY-20]MDO7867999.1 hypothetical protein [Nocardioides sp. WY-20]
MTNTPTAGDAATRATHRAWWSLTGFVPCFVLAFVVGEGIFAALGQAGAGGEQAPVWAVAAAAIPALLVFALPAVAATLLGRRALRLGDPRGRTPMVVALAVAGTFLLLNGLSALAVWLT